MIEPWRVERSVVTYRDRWLTVRSDDCRTVAGQEIAPYHVLEHSTWLNVVALTPEGRIVLVTEYRHGSGEVLTGLPSGTMDPTDPDAEAASRRELLEETGYGGGVFVPLGRYPANPANQTNDVTPFLAVGVEKIGEQELDHTEEIAVSTEDFAEWFGLLCRMRLRVQVSHVATAMLAARVVGSGEIPGLGDLPDRLRDAWAR
ncbi:NUDIX hydrolase [Tautonia plasticadhaerens]|nr:NUDIX hydrolase [Tautonia plasticadhaerens]